MIDIHVNVHCPDLVTAAGLLAKALGKPQAIPPKAPQEAPVPPQAAPMPPANQTPAPQPQAQPAAPVAPQTTSAAATTGNVVPMPQQQTPPPAQAPTAAPTYTIADLSLAGANLLRDNPALHPQLMGLLQQFGVKATTELQPDQLPAFANALRQLGAKL